MKRKHKPKTTPMQKEAVDNIMSGKYKSKKKALLAAGYSENTANNPGKDFIARTGVQKYLASFEKKAVVKFGMSLDQKIQEVYLDGLDADKPFGKNDIMPDHRMRKEFADTIQESRGMMRSKGRSKSQTFNFFMFDKESRDKFNDAFNDFVRTKSVEESA